jgi:uncharacterized membrane protein
VLAACVVTLLAGFLLKAQCTSSAGWDGRQYERLCYNDIQALYEPREVEERFPYVEGRLDGRELAGGAIEYPVLTGTFMWVTARFAGDFNGYLDTSAILLAPFGLLTAYLLARMSGARALLWALAPALVLYAFHNWELLVVAAAVGGFYLWHREEPLWAAAVFGVGGALKLFPLFLLLPLFLDVWMKRDVKAAGRVIASGIGTFAAINLPFVIASPAGWWATYEFHSLRTGNFDSIWYLGWPRAAPETINLVAAALVFVFFASAVAYGWVRARREQVFPFLQVGAALVASFMLWNKVHSPQYTLWILPFFVLLGVRLVWWFAYTVVDLMVYVGVFRWFYDFLYRGEDFTLAKKMMIAGVWGRALLLALLVAVFLKSRPSVVTGAPLAAGSRGSEQPELVPVTPPA